MRIRPIHWSRTIVAIAMLLAPMAEVSAAGDPALAYETVEPSRITLGETAIMRVTSLDGYLRNVPLPTVPGLAFEVLGRNEGLEFVGGHSTPAWYVIIRVTPKFVGVFSIPGLTAKSPTVGLEVVTADAPNPYAWRSQRPSATPAPMSKAPVPKGIQLKAGGAAFVQLAMPTRPVYVGETVPVDIELGIRPGIVTSLNGPPALSSGDFTLSNLSKQPLRRDQMIEGNPFLVMTWHSALAAVKPGEFTLAVETPLSVKVDTRSAEDQAVAHMLGWPFSQITYKGAPPKDVTVASPTSSLKVLSLPAQGRPKDFGGAVGDFQVSSDTSATHVTAGDPLTLRLRISGVGNFDRVDSTMFDHLDHWKTYPPKATFKPSDPAGNKGEKVFEQPLIAARTGEQSIPPLEFSYFNPQTQHYEHARTEPIKVMVSASLADSSLGAPAADGQNSTGASANQLTRGLRPDHPEPQSSVSELRPLYFQPPFLAVPTALVLILAGSLFAVRTQPARVTSKVAERALAQLDAAARSGDSSSFFETARGTLLQTFAARWRLSPEQITSAELKARLGTASEDVERLFALADEAKYSDYASGSTDFQRWLGLIRGQLAGGAG
jgi:oxygen tolerance protein BatD